MDSQIHEKFREKFTAIFNCAQKSIETRGGISEEKITRCVSGFKDLIMNHILDEIDQTSGYETINISLLYGKVQARVGSVFVDLMIQSAKYNQYVEFEFLVAIASNLSPDMVYRLFKEFKGGFKVCISTAYVTCKVQYKIGEKS